MTDAASRPGAASPQERAARPRWRGREGGRTTTRAEVTTTTGAAMRRRRGGGARFDDNYDGGDDNYPRGVLEMGAVGYAEGRGRDRQK